MQKVNIKLLKVVLCALMLLFVPGWALASDIDFNDQILDAPVDGGLSLLVAAGVGYGAKKIQQRKKNNLNKKNNCYEE